MKKFLIICILFFSLINFGSAFGGDLIKTTEGIIIIDRESNGITFQSVYTKGINFDASVFEQRSLLIEMSIIDQPVDMTIFVNQVWAEATIVSEYKCINGLTIDTMNDRPEGGNEQYGWWVNEDHPYVEEWFIGRFVNTERSPTDAKYGYCMIDDNMDSIKYLGTILQIDYDFYIKMDNDIYAYKFSFTDNIMFSSDGELVSSTDISGGNKDVLYPSLFFLPIGIICLIIIRKRNSYNVS